MATQARRILVQGFQDIEEEGFSSKTGECDLGDGFHRTRYQYSDGSAIIKIDPKTVVMNPNGDYRPDIGAITYQEGIHKNNFRMVPFCEDQNDEYLLYTTIEEIQSDIEVLNRVQWGYPDIAEPFLQLKHE